jgi:hypothetical protein
MSLFGNSRYLAKEDVGNGSVLTIKGFTRENVAKREEAPDEKYVMKFHETDKGLVMKPIIAQQLIRAFGLQSEEQVLTHLTNQQVTLYNDANVTMGGKFVGGTRVRLPQAGDVPFGEDGAPQPAQFRPDPRQTPPPQAYQQAVQNAPRPAAPRPPAPPQVQQPMAPAFQAPRPPAPSGYAPAPVPLPEDAPWPSEGQM